MNKIRNENENELANKVIDLCLCNSIEELNQHIKFLGNQVEFYKKHLQDLINSKPLFFQKKKLEKHNKKIEECENKIRDIYLKLDKEVEEIEKIQGIISA